MTIIPEINATFEEFRTLRRDLHAHPEIAFQEKRTSDLVAKKLSEWGIEVHRGLGITGVVGVLKNGNGASRIGLRADMDALCMEEENTFSHASQYKGAFHGCGHDGHTATLLAAAHYLAKTRRFNGTVIFVFQPAEEGRNGCQAMIKDGLFERFPADHFFGFHNWPGLAFGTVATRPHAVMASSNKFFITVKGKGSHGAMPHLGNDPIFTLMQIAQSLQGIVTRNKNPTDTAVLSICQLNAGTAHNVTPSTASMAGTLRTFDEKVTDLFEKRITKIATLTAQTWDSEVDIQFIRQYPVTMNDPTAVAIATQAAQDIVGASLVDTNCSPAMPSEDFSFFAQEVPSAFLFLGPGDGYRDTGHGAGPCELHNASYDFNDRLIPIGASIFARIVERTLVA